MRDDRDLMSVLKNDAISPRLLDWEKDIIRRTAYEMDALTLKLEQAESRLAKATDTMVAMLDVSRKDTEGQGKVAFRPQRGRSFDG